MNALTIAVAGLTWRRHRFNTALAETIFSPKGDTVSSRKGLPGKQRKAEVRHTLARHVCMAKNC